MADKMVSQGGRVITAEGGKLITAEGIELPLDNYSLETTLLVDDGTIKAYISIRAVTVATDLAAFTPRGRELLTCVTGGSNTR